MAWLSWFLILCNLYGASAAGLQSLGLRIEASDPLFAVRDRAIIVTGGGGKLGGQFARALLARGAFGF